MRTERRSRSAQRPVGAAGEGWALALGKAVLVVVLSWAGFLAVPDRLLLFLTTRVGPNLRDALVTGWVVVFFIGLSWGFVALQRSRGE